MHAVGGRHMLPVGWLPATETARRDGFLPVYRCLKRNGHSIVEDGFLSPALYWRHGRERGDTLLEGAYVLELLRSSAQYSLEGPWPTREYNRSTASGWSPQQLVAQIPRMGELVPSIAGDSLSGITVSSPVIPVSWRHAEWLAAARKILSVPQPRQAALMCDPARLFRAGYKMLSAEWDNHGPGRPQTAHALAILSLGALGLFPRLRCVVCYRLAMPGSNRCVGHSQTKVARVEGAHARTASDSRLAGNVMKELRWNPTDFVTDRGEDPHVEEKTICDLLWGCGDGGVTLENLRAAFRKGCFPHVRSTLPTNFCELSDARACATLRRCVDPREWVVSYWYARVAATEAWLEAAHILPRGRTHMTHSDLNRERVAKARAWLLDGLSKKEIASRLAVSSSHLSHLLRRLGK